MRRVAGWILSEYLTYLYLAGRFRVYLMGGGLLVGRTPNAFLLCSKAVWVARRQLLSDMDEGK